MRHLALILITLCLSMPALAERKQTYGDLDVHYSAFNSSLLQPEIAAAKGLERGKNLGLVNISAIKAGQAINASVSGEVKDLVGRSYALDFKQITEGEAIYYLAQFPFSHREMLRFTINVTPVDGVTHSFDFNQEFYLEQ